MSQRPAAYPKYGAVVPIGQSTADWAPASVATSDVSSPPTHGMHPRARAFRGQTCDVEFGGP